MKLGLQIVRFDWPAGPSSIRSHLADIAGTAEDAGFSSLWVMDHFFQIQWIGRVDDPMLGPTPPSASWRQSRGVSTWVSWWPALSTAIRGS